MGDEVRNYLGVDWGEAKIGLALADEETRMAFAYDTIKNEGDLADKIVEIIKKENVREVVIGVPAYLGEKKDVFREKNLGEILEKKNDTLIVQSGKAGAKQFNGVKVSYQNEMFTTKMAQKNLIEKGEKNVGKKDDAEAARIILQEWLDLN